MSCAIFRWLHFSDLHVGLSVGKRLWPSFKTKFFDDISKQYKNSGPWDAVFFTGDLTQMGGGSEFEELDQILDEIWTCFEELGTNPTLVVIPGNHDLKLAMRMSDMARTAPGSENKIAADEFAKRVMSGALTRCR